MTRVLFLHQNAELGGAEFHLLATAHSFGPSCEVVLFSDGPLRMRLEKAGVRVRIMAAAWAREGVRGGTPRVSVRGAMTVLQLAVRIAVRARNFDIIYANSPKALTIAALAGRMARRPVLWAFHDLLDASHFSRAAMRQMAITANWGARRVVVCSEASATELIRQGGRAGRISVVHQGIDAAEFCADAEAVEGLRHELNLVGRRVTGVFGRVTPWKGQHVAIELLGRFPDMYLLIAGDLEEAGYAESLQRRAADLGASHRLRLPGHRDDVAGLMQLVDIVLHTSVGAEPFGRVIVEAMLAGRPVIATNAGGVPEIVEDGVSGLLVPPGDVEALAKAVSELVDEPEQARRLGEAGRERARTRFTLAAMLAALHRHVEEVARG